MDDKPRAWNYDQSSGLKTIVPGDEVNTGAMIARAQARMGDDMAKQVQEDQQYKEDSQQFANDARGIGMMANGGSIGRGASAIDSGVLLGLGYFVARIFYWFSHPIPGLRNSKFATFIFVVSEIIITILVVVILLRWVNRSW